MWTHGLRQKLGLTTLMTHDTCLMYSTDIWDAAGGKHVRDRVGKWLLWIKMALRHCPSELLQGCVSQRNKLGFNSARLSAVHLIVNYISNYSQLRSTSWGLGAGAWSARGWRRDSLVFSLVPSTAGIHTGSPDTLWIHVPAGTFLAQ